jgi:spermidine synthase
VEIESAMAEASRGFMPRNSAAFADPRGAIFIDDAKSFFSTRNRSYDLIISEPSNPWVSGVSSLFTREFYRRIRHHLNPGGMLVQWIQLYEMDTSLVATVVGALGAEFAHYAIFAPSDYDLLIMAADAPIPYPPQAAIFEQPGVAKELWTVHVLSAGDLDARYLGSRATLEPLFKSYGMPANSDYAPVLDRNAARHRFTEKSAADLVALLNAEIPLLELLEPGRSKRAVNPLFQGAYAFERVENTRLAWYARDFLLRSRAPVPEAVPRDLQKDLELVKLRLLECREPRELDVWLHSAIRVAQALNPYLAPDDVGAVWGRIVGSACYPYLQDYQRRWLALFQAIGARNAPRMAELAAPLLAEPQTPAAAREYLLLAALTGYVASGAKPKALELWGSYSPSVRVTRPAFRLLRCHADPAGCGNAFRAYAER